MTVEILGRSLALDEQLRELQRAFPTNSLADLAILAALNLACEYLENKEDFQQLQENYEQLKTEIEERSRQLLQKLEVHDTARPPGP